MQVIETLVSAQDVTSYTWNVNVAAGTSVTLGLTDSTGTSAYAAQVSLRAALSLLAFARLTCTVSSLLAGHRPGGLVDLVRWPGCFRLGVGRYHRLLVARQLGCRCLDLGVSSFFPAPLPPATIRETDAWHRCALQLVRR